MDEHIKKIRKFCKDRDWEQFHDPKNLAVSLVLEASEVLEIFQWTRDGAVPKNKQTDLEEELADVFYWLLYLADKTGVDLNKAFKEKMEKNEKKYPVEKAKGSSKKYTKL